jgi:putative thiamine transport system ATP-binding protein
MLKVKDLTIEPLFREVNFCAPRGDRDPDGAIRQREIDPFAWMVGALSDDFQARGELWLDERRCDGFPSNPAGWAFSFRTRCCLTVQRRAKFAAGLPERIAGRARREAVEQALDSAGLAAITPAIRPPFPAGSAPGSACCAPCSRAAGAAAG